MRTFNEIMEAMLKNVPDELDKREGSVIYTALAPCAKELSEQYVDLETVLQFSFASSSLGVFLEYRTSEMGITRLRATKAVRKANFYGSYDTPIDVPIGSRFGIDNLVYAVINKISDGVFAVQCETSGNIGNVPSGTMLPVEYVSGLASAVLADIITPGTDDETDPKLLERYQLKVREPTTSGNAYHYKSWALEVAGVGDARIFPLWNGNGTVKVVLADNNRLPVTQTVIDDVAAHIEELRPIGAAVTVVSGVSKPISITASIILGAGYTLENVTTLLREALTSYLKAVTFKMDFVSLAKTGLLILGVEGILDYQNLKLNSSASNVILAQDEIPVLGTVTLEAISS